MNKKIKAAMGAFLKDHGLSVAGGGLAVSGVPSAQASTGRVDSSTSLYDLMGRDEGIRKLLSNASGTWEGVKGFGGAIADDFVEHPITNVLSLSNFLGPNVAANLLRNEPAEAPELYTKGFPEQYRKYMLPQTDENPEVRMSSPYVSSELAKHVNLPQAVQWVEPEGYADGGEVTQPTSTEATQRPSFHDGLFYTGDATAPASGPFIDSTVGQPFHGGNFYTGDSLEAPSSFVDSTIGQPFHGGLFLGGPNQPTTPSPAPVADTGYWANPISATQTFYPAAAFDATSPSGYFNYAHNFIQGDKAPGGFTTWAPYVEPPPPNLGNSEAR